jgi:LacI family transcriptional regulator
LIHDNPNAQMVLSFQEGVLDAIRDTEFALVVRPIDRRSPRMLEDVRNFLEQQRLFGVLLLPPVSEDDKLADLCRELGCAYVRMGSARLDDEIHLVESNDRQAVTQAVAELARLGHHRIGFVRGPEGFRSAAEREAGFRDAVTAHGLAVEHGLNASGDYKFESGLAAGGALLDVPQRPSAIFASNDEMAAGVLHAARARGIDVPSQLSIVGFDDTAIAEHIWPPLTTVRWPIRTMGRAAALKIIHPDEAADQPSRFLSDLVPRGSTARPA